MSVRLYVRLSTKSFSDSDEIWCVGRGRWVMHDGMSYDQIQGQGQETFKVRNWRNSSIFFNFQNLSSGIFNLNWQMTTDSETVEQYLNFVRTRFLISVLVFVSHDYELGRVWDFGGVDRQSRTGLIFEFVIAELKELFLLMCFRKFQQLGHKNWIVVWCSLSSCLIFCCRCSFVNHWKGEA